MHYGHFVDHVEAYFADIEHPDLTTLTARPTAVGWKVGESEFPQAFRSMTGLWKNRYEQHHGAWVNERQIASIVFSESFSRGIRIVKLMQLRPGSRDATGMVDHVDFLISDVVATEQQLSQAKIEWVRERNEMHEWVSARVNGRELKFVDHTVLDVGIAEMQRARDAVMDNR